MLFLKLFPIPTILGSLAEIKQVFCDNSTYVDKETVEVYITILYLCYKYDNR